MYLKVQRLQSLQLLHCFYIFKNVGVACLIDQLHIVGFSWFYVLF